MSGSHKKIFVLGSLAESLVNFRGPLLREMRVRGHQVIACAPAASDAVKNALIALDVEYRDVPLSRAGLNPVHDLRSLLALFRLLHHARPDVFFGYTIKPVIYGSLAARWAGVPEIFSMVTGLGYAFTSAGWRRRLLNGLVRGLYRLGLRGNRKVFFQNPDDRDLFLRAGLFGDSTQALLINGSGVDVDAFQSAPLPREMTYLLIARLIKDKGILEYVEAARMIKTRYPQACFRLVGWIDENPTAISAAALRAWVDEGLIDYMGKLDDVRPALAKAAVYVLPSYREGTPRTVLEAMAMGRPIVTTDVPGCRETVVDGVNGFLIPPQNPSALARAMERFIEDPALVGRMGRESRRLAEEKYDVRKVNAVILQAMGLCDEAPV